MTKETQELNNHIGEGLKIGPKGLTPSVETKVCQNDSAPMWHYFVVKFFWS
jgi:hypothetical protein